MAKKYSQEFKHQAVQLILEEGKTVAQAAHELRLHENTLYRWVTEVKKGLSPSTAAGRSPASF
ncbi:transposase [Aneurinibacillus aneurinilyticus]|uniref:transposase n=1 Tax=Aneurinibacillus aneurinilyticus TaxID=1391 RepID=UPI0035262E86